MKHLALLLLSLLPLLTYAQQDCLEGAAYIKALQKYHADLQIYRGDSANDARTEARMRLTCRIRVELTKLQYEEIFKNSVLVDDGWSDAMKEYAGVVPAPAALPICISLYFKKSSAMKKLCINEKFILQFICHVKEHEAVAVNLTRLGYKDSFSYEDLTKENAPDNYPLDEIEPGEVIFSVTCKDIEDAAFVNKVFYKS